MPAGQVGGGAVAVEQRPQPGVRPDDVGAAQRPVERRRDDVEQEADLGVGRLGDVRHGALDGLVGEADVDRAVGLGEQEDEAVGGARHRHRDGRGQAGDGGGAEHQVGAAAGAQVDVDEVAGPDAGGVDDRAGA